MNPSARITITPKGTDEVAHRTHRVGIRLRSLLLLLNSNPATVTALLKKCPFPPEETTASIETLLQQGFVAIDSSTGTAPSATPSHPVGASGPLLASPDIVLSEARFLLIDFCVDCFGTQSEQLTESIRACRNLTEFEEVLHGVLARVSEQKANHLAALHETIAKINATA